MYRPAARRLVALLATASLVAALAVPAPAAAVGGAEYVSLTNEVRADVNLAPVALHAAVDKVAVERGDHMAKYDAFEHDLAYVANRLKALGVCFTRYGEIIAYTTRADYTPESSIVRWVDSSSHYKIMTGDDYNAAGGSHTRSTKTNRMYSVMVFVKLCSGSTTPPPAGDSEISRLAGADRYATAAAISTSRFGAGAATVFVATGASFPDALAGAPAAAKARGPILLTARGELPAATAAEIDRLNPTRIVVLGGPSVVGDAVVSKLRAYAPVERWFGANRFETAAAISSRSFARGVGVAYVATAGTFPDALSGGAVAGRLGGPILLVERNAVPAATGAELSRLAPKKIFVLGGTGVVSESVRTALDRYTTGSVTRLAGTDRYATSVEISQSAYAASDSVFVATGANFPDGLAGGPVAALLPGPLLLVSSTALPSVVKSELQRLGPDRVFVLGGSGVVSNTVVNAIDAALP